MENLKDLKVSELQSINGGGPIKDAFKWLVQVFKCDCHDVPEGFAEGWQGSNMITN